MNPNIQPLEERIAYHGAPTLAGVKAASLFRIDDIVKGPLPKAFLPVREALDNKDLHLRVMRARKGTQHVFLYRQRQLIDILQRPEIRKFLYTYGYSYPSSVAVPQTYPISWSAEDAFLERLLSRLERRFQNKAEFPHEIGIFLGYPLEDTIGFIEQRGQNYLCAGCWKVYGDVERCLKHFEQYQKMRKSYLDHYRAGFSLARLAVANRAE